MTYPSAPPPNAPPGRSWLPWLLVGALAVAIVVLVALLLRNQDEAPDPPDVLPTPTEEGLPASPEPSPEPSEEPSEEPSPDAMPLLGPTESRFVDGASAIPTSEDSLEDGDYLGFLQAVDPVAGTVEFDVAIMYVGQAAIDWLTANDPGAENPPPNDYIIVNEVERNRTLPLAGGARAWDWCVEAAGGLGFVERTVAEWAAAPEEGSHTCEEGVDALPRDPANLYWFDVRDDVVQQVVGQYVP